jgi:hypothetical protein
MVDEIGRSSKEKWPEELRSGQWREGASHLAPVGPLLLYTVLYSVAFEKDRASSIMAVSLACFGLSGRLSRLHPKSLSSTLSLLTNQPGCPVVSGEWSLVSMAE